MPDPNIDGSCQGREAGIQKLIDAIDKKLSEGKGRWGDLPEDLRDDLRDTLHDTTIKCLGKETADCQAGIQGRVTNSEISLCPGANEATLLHEIVHVNGGGELDSEALENHLYVTKDTYPTPGDFDKFIGSDAPCGFMDGKTSLLASRFVIWDPKSGELWVRAGTRAQPKKGKKLKAEFKADSSTLDKLKKKAPGDCNKQQAKKCGARCKDFDTYGLCDRKVYHPPCYQHRSAT